MRWPSSWASSSPSPPPDPEDKRSSSKTTPPSKPLSDATPTASPPPHKPVTWNSILNATDWSSLTSPRTLIPTLLLTTSILGFYKFYRSYLRRIPAATAISPGYFRRRSILGKVVAVGDGDNFRVYHTPGGRLAGWGWLPGRRVPEQKKELKNRTIHIRLAGIDAPELAHFGRPAQPYSQDALDWLTSYVLHRRVRAYVYKTDQYGRVVATVYIWRGLLKRDVGLQMLRSGWATVYEAKTGAEFGEGLEEKYRMAERWARLRRVGMWRGKMKDYESPREYKTRMGVGAPVEEEKKSKGFWKGPQ